MDVNKLQRTYFITFIKMYCIVYSKTCEEQLPMIPDQNGGSLQVVALGRYSQNDDH